MTKIILHHYELSPFSEKVRRVLAYKKIPWFAVEQPVMAPKPDLTPLTGGYRRIPVMQVGADIYCDTALIIRHLEHLHPERPVIPTAKAGIAAMIEDWADHRVFMHVVPPVVVALQDALPPGFFDDRKAMSPGFDRDGLIAGAPHALSQTAHDLEYLEMQLSASRYLLGDDFSIADAACFHTVRFLKNDPGLIPLIERYRHVAAWVRRIEDFGPGEVTAMAPADALAIAKKASPQDTAGAATSDAPYRTGDQVTVIADDYGQETTTGKVARILHNEITILREDENLGTLAVHYPRAGYRIIPNS